MCGILTYSLSRPFNSVSYMVIPTVFGLRFRQTEVAINIFSLALLVVVELKFCGRDVASSIIEEMIDSYE